MNRRTFEYLYDKFIIHLNYALKLQLFSHITNIFTFFLFFLKCHSSSTYIRCTYGEVKNNFSKKIGQPKNGCPTFKFLKCISRTCCNCPIKEISINSMSEHHLISRSKIQPKSKRSIIQFKFNTCNCIKSPFTKHQ